MSEQLTFKDFLEESNSVEYWDISYEEGRSSTINHRIVKIKAGLKGKALDKALETALSGKRIIIFKQSQTDKLEYDSQ